MAERMQHRPGAPSGLRLAASAVAPLLFSGCAALDHSAGNVRAARADLGARPQLDARPRTIVQEGSGRDTRFVLVSGDRPPTPKTLASALAAMASHSTSSPPALSAVSRPPSQAGGRTAARATRFVEPVRVRERVGSIYFGVGESRLTPPAMATIVDALRRAGRDDQLVLTAYTDPRGTAAGNRQLADARASAVAGALERRGVEPGRVIVLSRPQCCAAGPTPEPRLVEYRRVDIEVLKS
jgi:outer membrane protein OmpA-like peptidoglycan-associated protein